MILFNYKTELEHLLKVGTEKSIGYLPKSTIKERVGFENYNYIKSELEIFALEQKLILIDLNENDCDVFSGAIYLYSPLLLNNILSEFENYLIDDNIPTNPTEFIEYIISNVVYDHIYPISYRIIALCFNDKRYTKEDVYYLIENE